MEGEEPPQLGRRVVVYGGGNTAIDAARTAKRLGAEEAVVVYRRTRDRMPAHDVGGRGGARGGRARASGCRRSSTSTTGRLVLERWSSTSDGFPQPTGELEELEADSLVLALGQESRPRRCSSGVAGRRDRTTASCGSAPDLMTGHPGVFAGGDIVPAERTVTIGDRPRPHGRRAASTPGCAGAGTSPRRRPSSPTFDALNTWYYADAPQHRRARSSTLARRESTFDEVVGGLDADTALFEARRCLSCGNCFACDNCYGVCPDNAVIKLDPGGAYAYAIDLDYCKGCGLCAQECPCGAIEMGPEIV